MDYASAGRSATTDRLDDFDDIAFGEDISGVIAMWDDFKIDLNRQTFALQSELFDQLIDAGLCCQALLFAIDRYIHGR
jgi:hypothetical protein